MELHNRKKVSDDCLSKKGSKLVKRPPRKNAARKRIVPCFNIVSKRKEKARPINNIKLMKAAIIE